MPRLLKVSIAFLFFAFGAVILVRPILFYRSIPQSNTALTHFDTLLVLGYPCTDAGTPTPEQRERTLEAVREFQRGIAPHIIVSGGAAHNRFAESHCMKQLALAQGVPADAVIEEDRAANTLENAFYSSRIMAAHGWHSAEIISSPSHLPRAALILQHYPILWRTHPSPWPHEYNPAEIAVLYFAEARHCWQVHTHGFPRQAFPAH